MPFTKETASKAGKKSKRPKDGLISEIRENYLEILKNNQEKFQALLDRVSKEDPAKALEILLKLGSFVIPKPRPNDSQTQELDTSKVPEWMTTKSKRAESIKMTREEIKEIAKELEAEI